jgi:hypothetical protein
MSFAADSRVKTSHGPVQEQASTVNARVFGPSTPEWLANFDPGTSLWRTSQGSLFEEGLAEFSETWPRSGMTRSGTAYRLPHLELPISEIDSGYLPTPRKTDADRGGRGDLLQVVRGNPSPSGHFRIWPTPVADDTGHRKRPYSQGGRSLSYMAGGQLNPEWTGWLMGFPPKWTELEPSEMP